MNEVGQYFTMFELEHYGIKDMAWGVKRGPPYPIGSSKVKLAKLLRKSYTSNLSKWGESKESNICFVTGYSGSGKSTIAQGLMAEDVDVLHLDLYFQPNLSSADTEKQNENFNRFLAENKISFPSEVPLSNWKRTTVITRFEKAIENFGRLQYDKKRRVLVEGVELLDTTLFPDKSYFNTKPLILTGTNFIESMRRAFRRDGRGGLLKGLANLDSAASYISWYYRMGQSIAQIKESSDAKRGEKIIDEILKKIDSNLT